MHQPMFPWTRRKANNDNSALVWRGTGTPPPPQLSPRPRKSWLGTHKKFSTAPQGQANQFRTEALIHQCEGTLISVSSFTHQVASLFPGTISFMYPHYLLTNDFIIPTFWLRKRCDDSEAPSWLMSRSADSGPPEAQTMILLPINEWMRNTFKEISSQHPQGADTSVPVVTVGFCSCC